MTTKKEGCPYPYYGMGPHTRVVAHGCRISTELPRDEWPDNYQENHESPGCGVYECPRQEKCDTCDLNFGGGE